MLVPSNLHQVKQRLDRYLWDDESIPLTRLRKILFDYFWEFPSVAVVGGLVRDVARRGSDGFKSDIDLVIDGDPSEVTYLAKILGASPNRFGGFSYQHPLWKIDFWALETTWAARSGYVKLNSVTDIVSCTFFDWDSCLYEIKSRKIHAKPGYLDNIHRRIIEVNLLPNPSVNGNLLRAIRRILLWNLQPGPILRDFIEANLNDDTMRGISQTENQIYHNPVISSYPDHWKLMREVNFRSGRLILDNSHGYQLDLPLYTL